MTLAQDESGDVTRGEGSERLRTILGIDITKLARAHADAQTATAQHAMSLAESMADLHASTLANLEQLVTPLRKMTANLDAGTTVPVNHPHTLSAVDQKTQRVLEDVQEPTRRLTTVVPAPAWTLLEQFVPLDFDRLARIVTTRSKDAVADVARAATGDAAALVAQFSPAQVATLEERVASMQQEGSRLVAPLGAPAVSWWSQASALERVVFIYVFYVMVMVLSSCAVDIADPGQHPAAVINAAGLFKHRNPIRLHRRRRDASPVDEGQRRRYGT
jgi:hypothetical protein